MNSFKLVVVCNLNLVSMLQTTMLCYFQTSFMDEHLMVLSYSVVMIECYGINQVTPIITLPQKSGCDISTPKFRLRVCLILRYEVFIDD